MSKFARGEHALDERRLRAWLRGLGVEWEVFAQAVDQALGRRDACVD